MAEIVVLPTKGLIMLERSLRKYLADKAAREQAARQSNQISERLSAVYGTPVEADANFSFDIQAAPVGAGIK